ncbi:MAG TPA: SsrA-binding protein SmpB [Bacilli bacterium]|nr:MAG: SsrA-binding protein [Tenericutes bacterium ADurb.BinA124]HPX84754.1 SsrA-binding protein SmpB [Bacilli bacterium]
MEKSRIVARNKKAAHDYFILDKYECGIVLTGTEIKSIRAGKVAIADAYCRIEKQELIIINMHIAPYDKGNIFNHQETRTRKLLAHKSEIRKLAAKLTQDGLTLIPLSVYLREGLAKVEVALCKGKKNYDKREDLRQEAIKTEIKKINKVRGRI